MTNKVKKKSW